MVTSLGSRSDPREVHLQSKPFWLMVAAWRKAGRLSKLDDSLVERGVGRWQFHMPSCRHHLVLSCRHHLVSRCVQLWSPVFKNDEVERERMTGGHLLLLRSTLGVIWGARGLLQKRRIRLCLLSWMQMDFCPSYLHSKQGDHLQASSNSETMPLLQCSTEVELIHLASRWRFGVAQGGTQGSVAWVKLARFSAQVFWGHFQERDLPWAFEEKART